MTDVAAETPLANLGRVLADAERVAEAERWLRGNSGPAGLLLVDLDGSAAIRRQGIEAKVALVRQAQAEIAGLLGPGERLLDSGTRDEMYVALPGRRLPDTVAAGERIRAAIAERLPVTASVGAVATAEAVDAHRLMWMAREALEDAKRVRDTVASRTEFPVREAAVALVAGRPAADPHRVVEALAAKHTGRWHWAVTHWPAYAALAGGERPPCLAPTLAEDDGLVRLQAEAAAELLLRDAGPGAGVAVLDAAPPDWLEEVLPDGWVSAADGGGRTLVVLAGGRPTDLVERAARLREDVARRLPDPLSGGFALRHEAPDAVDAVDLARTRADAARAEGLGAVRAGGRLRLAETAVALSEREWTLLQELGELRGRPVDALLREAFADAATAARSA